MTKQHLYPNKFFNWRGWDFIKWPFALCLLAGILWIIWCYYTNQPPVKNMPKPIEKTINVIEKATR